jgi:hypothetical protein
MAAETAPWTIERISDALGNPTLRQQFIGEINKAPIYELATVGARWQGIAEQLLHGVELARELHTQRGPDGQLPGEWTDVTDQVKADAERIRARRNAA